MVATRKRDYGDQPSGPGANSRPRTRRLNPAKPSKDGICHLLDSLPAELRNRVYDFALYAPEGLFLRKFGKNTQSRLCTTTTLKRGSKIKIVTKEVNQLQYTCRQLRAETKGYGLKANGTLTYYTRDEGHKSPLAAGAGFFISLDPKWYLHLKHVHIQYAPQTNFDLHACDTEADMSYDIKAQNSVLAFCRYQPQMQVHWACPRWILHNSICLFLFQAVRLCKAYRGTNLNNLLHVSSLDSINIDDILAGRKTEVINVPNFRIHPWNVGNLNNYLRSLEMAGVTCARHLPASATMADWVGQCMNWYFEGI